MGKTHRRTPETEFSKTKNKKNIKFTKMGTPFTPSKGNKLNNNYLKDTYEKSY